VREIGAPTGCRLLAGLLLLYLEPLSRNKPHLSEIVVALLRCARNENTDERPSSSE
jgi:hypothetical protein